MTVRQSRNNKKTMKKTTIILAIAVILFAVFIRQQLLLAQPQQFEENSGGYKDFRWEMANGINIEQRKRQVPAIVAAFSRYTVPVRARQLAQICYRKTLGTLFMPMDLAEIALAETGGHQLSAKAVSVKGALGVWQLMPFRARSHGYSPDDMENDEKCADAAVRELTSKLVMARGNLTRAKKLYCGVGPDADAYDAKRRQYRREIMRELDNTEPKQAEAEQKMLASSS
jgi:hypothetical protein